MTRQLVEDVRGGSDRVRGVEHREPGGLTGGDDPPGERLIPGDVGVRAGGEPGRLDPIGVPEHLGGLAQVVSGAEGELVGRLDVWLLGELRRDPLESGIERAVEHPGHETHGEKVLGAQRVAALDPRPFEGSLGEVFHRNPQHPVGVERSVLDGVGGVTGLGEVALVEGVGVDDQDSSGGEVGQVGPERRRVHGHQHVGLVSRGEDVAIGDMHLER